MKKEVALWVVVLSLGGLLPQVQAATPNTFISWLMTWATAMYNA